MNTWWHRRIVASFRRYLIRRSRKTTDSMLMCCRSSRRSRRQFLKKFRCRRQKLRSRSSGWSKKGMKKRKVKQSWPYKTFCLATCRTSSSEKSRSWTIKWNGIKWLKPLCRIFSSATWPDPIKKSSSHRIYNRSRSQLKIALIKKFLKHSSQMSIT